jgi:hypothetical protein
MILLFSSAIYISGVVFTFIESNNKFTNTVKISLLSVFWPMFLFCGLVIGWDDDDSQDDTFNYRD